ncbi:uncharacterized protein [Nicotiana tomentosiformis]|uniref:uncharacterized protein n=1 Tax=Nicotiana tomentosiformis TaxID=4098 RepID=UPI00388CBB16
MGSLAHLEACQRPLTREVHQLASLGVRLADSNDGGVIVLNRTESSLATEVKEKQYNDPVLVQLKEGIHKHKTTVVSLGMDDGSTNIYYDLKEINWWNDMKRGVADFVAKCSNCQQGSWDDHLPLIEFAYNNSFDAGIQMTTFKALYGRRCRLSIGWFEVGEVELIGPDHVHQAVEKVKIIKERLKTAQSRQKSYSVVRRRDLEFKEDDWVFLKVSPMKGIMQFGNKGKLSPSQVQKLRNKQIAPVKVLWRNQQVKEATWEVENEMKKKYPHLFE